MPPLQDPRQLPTLPAQGDSEVTLTQLESPLPEFASSQPPMHHALTQDELMMVKTLPPLPMVGNARELLRLAGDTALEHGDALTSERCTQYRGEPTEDDLGTHETDKVPAFHFDAISHMSDDAVAEELEQLLATPGANVERRIMLYLARRHFVLGLAAYGPVKLFDGRDNTKEMREEAADFLFYFGKDQLEREQIR